MTNCVIADRKLFFSGEGAPIALRVIRGDCGVQHDGDLTSIRHSHDFSELILITAGGGEHWIDGETYRVEAGDIFLIQGNTEHFFQARHKIEMFNIMFDDGCLQERLRSLRSMAGFNAFFLFEPAYRNRHKFQSRLHVSPEGMRPLRSVLQQMAEEAQARRAGWDLVLFAKLLEIFVFISREYASGQNRMVRSLCHLGELIGQLESRYQEKWTIERIARSVSMAPSTLLPIFKRVTGYSPIEYLLQVRLAKAAELLRSESLTISEIAEMCGFADSNYFTRQFRKHYRISPRDYRRN